MRVTPLAALTLAACLAVALAMPVAAHHSFSSEFDTNQPIKFTGTLKRVEWMNPHIWYYVDVKNADGTMITWALAGGAPGQLMRRGITKDLLKLGATVVVEGFRARDGSNNGFGQKVTYDNGLSIFTANPQDRN